MLETLESSQILPSHLPRIPNQLSPLYNSFENYFSLVGLTSSSLEWTIAKASCYTMKCLKYSPPAYVSLLFVFCTCVSLLMKIINIY